MDRREPGSNLVSQHDQRRSRSNITFSDGQLLQQLEEIQLPMPRRECVHPERRIGSGHGTYDDILLLNELPDTKKHGRD